MFRAIKLFAVSSLALCLPTMASASIIVNGSSTSVALGGGLRANGNSDPTVFKGNEFSTPELIKNQGDETKTGTILFSEIPVVDLGASGLFFQLIYGVQETSKKLQVNLDDIVIAVGANTIWNYDQVTNGSILVNSVPSDLTATPLGSGGDMELLIPVAMFNGLGYKGSDTLSFTATQSNSDDGGDE